MRGIHLGSKSALEHLLEEENEVLIFLPKIRNVLQHQDRLIFSIREGIFMD